MRIALLLSLVIAGAIDVSAQTPAAPPVKPAPPATTSQPRPAPAAGASAPAPQTPAPTRRAAPVTARGGMAITVTDPKGGALPDVHVEATGPTERSGDTSASGQINLLSMLAGTYRLRFTGDKVITFEREVAIRAGQVADVDVTLYPAPEPPPPPPVSAPPPPVVAPAPVGPKGQPLTLGILDLLEKDFLKKEPRRESLLSCSGSERTAMIQLNEPLPVRLYESADAVYYVLGGEGSVTLDGTSSKIATNGFVSVPRGTRHAFERRGPRPLILLAVLSGEPCEKAR